MKRDLDRFDNPWTPPAAETLEVQPLPEVWADGNVIVLRPGTDLPERCVICNSRDRVTMRRKRVVWHHPALYLLILLNPLVYFVVALIVRRSARVQVGLCETHHRQRLARIFAGLGVTGLGILISALQFGNGGGMLLLAIGFTIVALLVTFFLAQTVSAERIDARWVRLKGAGAAFLDGLPRERR